MGAAFRRCWTSGQPPGAIARARVSQLFERFVERLPASAASVARGRSPAPVAASEKKVEQLRAARISMIVGVTYVVSGFSRTVGWLLTDQDSVRSIT